jgi:hypothetical protein
MERQFSLGAYRGQKTERSYPLSGSHFGNMLFIRKLDLVLSI